ncbi:MULTISPECIES: DUF982 domain-containing protein [Agrobacterium tumefaciens complex]|uniref:DUF982 domain-containing protein n=1 Tax=Agrobacterium tumefaciens complex TaxID=1183400 RepID=UPI000761F885|nr:MULTISPECIES: DUF982 domain-containing protein [Agrobacterium tumefaciens complex]KAB0462399.1 DUF982 domain-containing protein [Agrobacterium tumefaciens]KWT80562.1 hypothetical protein ASH09_04755 [Agrobacterium radiobacter]MDP9787518.1 hypothetical protein [Agrobacterium tumefaciens]MDP9854519.1 hypothetical protein [Agrobacterium tumefaciens]NIB09210.1 DUF982 domain-containing protein [Agrobacterium radiobacter]
MNSQDVLFRAPVRVRMQCGLERIFLSVYDALDYLEHEWPLRRGDRYKRAVHRCRAALAWAASPDVAREAFIAACLEAGMPMVMTSPPVGKQRPDLQATG